MRKETARHDFIGETGADYVVVEYVRDLIAKSLHGTKRGQGTTVYELSDGRMLMELGDDDEPNTFQIIATGEIIRRR